MKSGLLRGCELSGLGPYCPWLRLGIQSNLIKLDIHLSANLAIPIGTFGSCHSFL
jgi:hypothetical protein